jgi:hypothetical protein
VNAGAGSMMASEWEGSCGFPWQWSENPDLWLYRDRTLAILHRFFWMSMETGRLPSILGQEFFRSHVTSYNLSSFEDVVIFVHDVERCIDRLDQFSKDLIGRIALQGFTQEEAARLVGCSRRTVVRRYPEALDRLSEIFLRVGVLLPFPKVPEHVPTACQEDGCEENPVTM